MNNHLVNRLINLLVRSRARSKWTLLVVGLVVGYVVLQPVLENQFGIKLPSLNEPQAQQSHSGNRSGGGSPVVATTDGEQAILSAFDGRKSDIIVEVTARVKKILPDDKVGSRHQKAILRLSSGHTVLLAHNIDLADRVPFDEGDEIEICGEYEYSDQGGVLHWTHHDPGRRRKDGWIKHDGKVYK